MAQLGLDHRHRHRDKDGAIARKHGDTLIKTLREKHGSGFARDEDENAKLIDVLHKLDDTSLGQLTGDTK